MIPHCSAGSCPQRERARFPRAGNREPRAPAAALALLTGGMSPGAGVCPVGGLQTVIRGRTAMKANYAIAFAVLSGLCGAAAVEGLHAQTKAKKAYTVSELETLDAKLAADVAVRIAKAQELSGGHNFRTGGGK